MELEGWGEVFEEDSVIVWCGYSEADSLIPSLVWAAFEL
jgi:hypothetical protein